VAGCQLAHARARPAGRATVGLRVTGQSTIGSSQTAGSAGGGTRGYIRWMADAIWILGPRSLGGPGRACGRGRRCDRPDCLVRRRRFRRWRLLAHSLLGGRRLQTGQIGWCQRPQRVCGGLSASLTSSSSFHPFARGRMKAGPVNSPGEASVRRMGDEGAAGEQERMIYTAAPRPGRCPAACGSRSHDVVTAQTITRG
jgi:hypothetical protein